MILTCYCITQRKTNVEKLHQLNVKVETKKAVSGDETAFNFIILDSDVGGS